MFPPCLISISKYLLILPVTINTQPLSLPFIHTAAPSLLHVYLYSRSLPLHHITLPHALKHHACFLYIITSSIPHILQSIHSITRASNVHVIHLHPDELNPSLHPSFLSPSPSLHITLAVAPLMQGIKNRQQLYSCASQLKPYMQHPSHYTQHHLYVSSTLTDPPLHPQSPSPLPLPRPPCSPHYRYQKTFVAVTTKALRGTRTHVAGKPEKGGTWSRDVPRP